MVPFVQFLVLIFDFRRASSLNLFSTVISNPQRKNNLCRRLRMEKQKEEEKKGALQILHNGSFDEEILDLPGLDLDLDELDKEFGFDFGQEKSP